ncbi:dsDNA nuclease domain-containing protein [Micromonospora sediminicola]|uniref:dsDNA nuclease domain-containing protein n=1 Tax=Micromonospora sediminicola TaxID=946078 RepID=UPI0033E163AD
MNGDPQGGLQALRPPPAARSPAEALVGMASDPTGSTTFARYVWQAKQAVRQWLTCLAQDDPPEAVLCERVEDIVLVYPDRIRFLQLKTRDRGSWSANVMCDQGHGIDALTRSYAAAKDAGVEGFSTFELWLEGPEADSASTAAFVKSPSSASAELRRKISRFHLRQGEMDDFLARLVIRPKQPPQSHIDAVVLQELGALWTGLSSVELSYIYDLLLSAAESAQAAEHPKATICGHLATALETRRTESGDGVPDSMMALHPIRDHLLHVSALRALTPPLPNEPVDKLLSRISEGSSTLSALELKMRKAGGQLRTIERAQRLRAELEVKRLLLLGSQAGVEGKLDQLADRVLMMAEATADRVALGAAVNPAAAGRSADVIAADLLSRPGELGALDHDSLFNRDGFAIYGLLCQLSDACRFGWRAV